MNHTLMIGLGICAALVGSTSAGVEEHEVTYLFVQNAEGLKVKGDKLILKDVSSSTVYFSDRPERIAGHMTTREFVDIWDEGDESFEMVNPNAALSYYDGDDIKTAVIVLRDPVMKWGDLSYSIELLSGELPSKGKDCSLFIDVIGRPRSPNSAAGHHRRKRRRHVVVGRNIARANTIGAYEDAAEAEARADRAEAAEQADSEHSPEEKMDQLDKMYKEGWINKEEYEEKKEEILSSF